MVGVDMIISDLKDVQRIGCMGLNGTSPAHTPVRGAVFTMEKGRLQMAHGAEAPMATTPFKTHTLAQIFLSILVAPGNKSSLPNGRVRLKRGVSCFPWLLCQRTYEKFPKLAISVGKLVPVGGSIRVSLIVADALDKIYVDLSGGIHKSGL